MGDDSRGGCCFLFDLTSGLSPVDYSAFFSLLSRFSVSAYAANWVYDLDSLPAGSECRGGEREGNKARELAKKEGCGRGGGGGSGRRAVWRGEEAPAVFWMGASIVGRRSTEARCVCVCLYYRWATCCC